MLRELAVLLESCTVGAKNSSDLQRPNIAFINPGEVEQKTAAGIDSIDTIFYYYHYYIFEIIPLALTAVAGAQK